MIQELIEKKKQYLETYSEINKEMIQNIDASNMREDKEFHQKLREGNKGELEKTKDSMNAIIKAQQQEKQVRTNRKDKFSRILQGLSILQTKTKVLCPKSKNPTDNHSSS